MDGSRKWDGMAWTGHKMEQWRWRGKEEKTHRIEKWGVPGSEKRSESGKGAVVALAPLPLPEETPLGRREKFVNQY
jgi:hypothetical protein